MSSREFVNTITKDLVGSCIFVFTPRGEWVAIVKATNHVECPPKERHIRKILGATSAIRPRADVKYCLHALARRLAKTCHWTVALKTLIVIHWALREGDPTFREELLNFQQRARVLQLANFKDDSTPIAWDCSAWVRTYGLFLEERLECFKILKYDIEAERIPRPAQGEDNKGYSRTRELDSEQLLEQLPSLQQLLYRLMGCQPEGAAVGNYVIQYALALVLKESFKIYCVVNDGIINLIDKFFEMPRHEAIKALDIYKRAGQQAGSLSDFYEVCKGLELARNFQFPVLREVLQSTIYEVDLDRILQSIHVYLQDLGMEEIRRAGADDKPLCMLKTVLHELVKLRGTAIKGHLSMVPIDMEPPPIILAYIDLNLQTLAAARMLTSTGPVGQTHWGDSMANNPVPYTHSADAQLKDEMFEIKKEMYNSTRVNNIVRYTTYGYT